MFGRVCAILKKIIIYAENIVDELIKKISFDAISDIDFVQKITFTEDYFQGYEKQFAREMKKRVK